MERAAVVLAREGFLGNIYSDSSGKSALVPPLYAGFLAGVYFIFGWNTVVGRLIQELFAVTATMAGICLLPLMARKLRLPTASGWAAAFCLAVLPINLWIETSGAWEQPYASVAMLVLLWAFCTLHDEQWENQRAVSLTGILLGVIGLLSPSLLPAGGLMLVSELLSQRGRRKQVFAGGLLILAISAVVVSPWILRNYYALGGFVPIRSGLGLELAIGNNRYANGKTFANSSSDVEDPFYRMHPVSNVEENARLVKLGELAYMREKHEAALHWIGQNPYKFAELTLIRFVLFWFPPVSMWPPSSPARRFKSLALCLIGAGMFCGLVRLGLNRHQTGGLLAAAVLGSSIVYTITHVDPRYSYTVFGLSALLAFDFVISAVMYLPYRNFHNISRKDKVLTFGKENK